MTDLVRDLRHGVRLLLKERTFSGTVLLTLAVCLGANVAIYSVIHTVLLDPLPFPAPERLVTVFNSYPGAGSVRGANGTVDFYQRRENIAAFEDVTIYRTGSNTVGEAGALERVRALNVTPSFFPTLGMEAALGRTFTEDEMEPANARKVVLTHGYWEERFASGADALGSELRVDGEPFVVVGVLPEDAPTVIDPEARLYFPLAFTEAERGLDRWHSNNFQMIARLREGATVEQATAQNRALNDALIEQAPIPDVRQLLEDVGYQTVVEPTARDMVRDVGPLLLMLWAGAGLVLLIGCVNVANLMLARAQTRVTEVATQLALGAPARRVAGQVFTHAVLLAVVGGVMGLGLGAAGLRLLSGLGVSDLPRGTEVGIDASVVGFTVLLAVGAGVLFGSIPVVQVLRGDLAPVFRSAGRTGTASRRAVLLRNGLVTGQVGLAFVLLIGAGLMFMSLRAALSVDPGFAPGRVLTASVALPAARYPDGDARRAFWDLLLAEVRATPSVEAASLVTALPFSGNASANVTFPEGYEVTPGESLVAPATSIAGPGYFEAMGILLVEGRAFTEADGPDQPRVMVIDEWLADRFWADASPIGHRMVMGVVPGDSIPPENVFTVIGVVRTIKHNDLTVPLGEHVGAHYRTYRQSPPGGVTLAVRARGEDAAGPTTDVREVLTRLDPELPLYNVQTMQSRIDDSLLQRRAPLVLLGVFAAVALFLAMVGIYGALAYTVSQRTNEIGIRMAMGSAPADVFRTVVGQGLRVTAIGLAVGAAASYFLTRFIRSLLFGVEATDPRVLVGVALLLATVGLVACIVPARRATSVSPMEALLGQ